MDVGLGMQLTTRDDKDAGTVDRLILDPHTGAVKAIVIRKGTLFPRVVEVPMGALEIGNDGNVRLSYIEKQINDLPPFDSTKYEPPPFDYVSPFGYPPGALYWPIGVGVRSSEDTYELNGAEPAALPREDLENSVIREGSAVNSRDGRQVGVVHRLTYDPNSGELRHFVVREGMLFTKDVELPASLIAKVDHDIVHLTIEAEDLRKHEIA